MRDVMLNTKSGTEGFRNFLAKLPLIEFLLIYFVSLNFVLVVPTVILGLSMNGVLLYFRIYTVILFASFVLLAVWIRRYFSRGIRSLLTCLKWRNGILVFLVILLWASYIVLITLYTPIFKNWDAIAVYLPMAKAIQTTSSLKYNTFFLSQAEMGYPPLNPILYAFIMFTIGDPYVKLIPIIYFVGFLLLIYRISSEFFDRAICSLLIFLFLVMPSTQTYFGRASLFLDLEFAFYLMISLYFFFKCLKTAENRGYWCFILGMASGLLLMSKEFGVSLFLVILSLFIFIFVGVVKNLHVKAVLLAFLAFFPHLSFSIFHIALNAHVYYYYRGVIVLTFFVAYCFVAYSISKGFSQNYNRGTIRTLILFLVPAVSSALYMFYNIAVRGQASPGLQFATELRLRSLGIPLPSTGDLDAMSREIFSFQNFFLAFPMAMFIVPLVLGLFVLCYDLRRRNAECEKKILLLATLYLVFIWGFTGFQVGGDNYRRFIPLSLFIAFFIAYDYKGFPFQFMNDLKYKSQIQFSLISLAFAYTWFFVDNPNFDYVPLYSKVVNSQPLATPLNLLIFVAIFSPYVISRVVARRISDRKVTSNSMWRLFQLGTHHKQIILKGFSVLALLLNVLLPAYLVARTSMIVCEHTWDPTYYSDVFSVEAFYGDPLIEIATYYLENINNSDVTVTFGMDRLAYLTQRPLIDCAKYDQLLFLSPLLKTNNSAEIAQGLNERNIRYFLLPDAGSWAYQIFSRYEDFELFRMVTQQRVVAQSERVYTFNQLKAFVEAEATLYELILVNTE